MPKLTSTLEITEAFKNATNDLLSGKNQDYTPSYELSYNLCEASERLSVDESEKYLFDLLLKCQEKNAIALYLLGLLYDYNSKDKNNKIEAFNYYKQAAEQNCVPAIHNVGVFYENGIAVKQDFKIAVEYYQKAAEAGLYKSLHNLGNCYFDGKGVARDLVKAFGWYEKAALQGSPLTFNMFYHVIKKRLGEYFTKKNQSIFNKSKALNNIDKMWLYKAYCLVFQYHQNYHQNNFQLSHFKFSTFTSEVKTFLVADQMSIIDFFNLGDKDLQLDFPRLISSFGVVKIWELITLLPLMALSEYQDFSMLNQLLKLAKPEELLELSSKMIDTLLKVAPEAYNAIFKMNPSFVSNLINKTSVLSSNNEKTQIKAKIMELLYNRTGDAIIFSILKYDKKLLDYFSHLSEQLENIMHKKQKQMDENELHTFYLKSRALSQLSEEQIDILLMSYQNTGSSYAIKCLKLLKEEKRQQEQRNQHGDTRVEFPEDDRAFSLFKL